MTASPPGPPQPPGGGRPPGEGPHDHAGASGPIGASDRPGASGPTGPSSRGPGGGGTPVSALLNGATRHGLMGQKHIRHPWELPLLYTGIVLAILAYLAWGALLFFTVALQITEGQATVEDLWQMVGVLPFLVQLAVALPLTPIIVWWVRAIMYARMRATAVRMSPTQFPEGYRMVVEAAEAFGMRKVPDAYVMMGSGVVNAFAVGHGFRRYVVIHSDMFEVGGRSRDPEALRFVIGHEVGHLAAGHVSYFRLVFTNLLSLLPILGPALSRAQEYTADNFGYAYEPAGAPGVMGVLSGGKYLNAEVNVNELADRAATDPSLFVHWVNWTTSHPVVTWRAHALRDRSRPGSLWIRPGGALYRSPLPPGHVWSTRYPSPADALSMLDAAARDRPVGAEGQFGRFSGADYSARPSMRQIQLAEPLLSQRTSYVIPPGPYRDDARGQMPGAAINPFAGTGRQPPQPPPPTP